MPPELPAYLQNDGEQFAVDSLTANLGAGMPPYVSIAENRFKLVDSAGDEEPIATVDPKTGIPYFDACIIDWNAHPSKVYFSKPYDPADPAPPDCFSDNGVAPSVAASNPQSPTCAGCPKAEWGSATSKVSGKGIPACSKTQKLALALPGDDVVFLLRVPPNSLDNLRAYTKKFQGQKVSLASVMTRISFEKGVIGTLTFNATAYIDQKMALFRNKVRAEKGTDVLVGRTDKPRGAALAGPAPAHALPAPVDAGQAGPLAQQPAQTAVSPTVTTTPAVEATAQTPGASPSNPAPAGRRGRRKTAEPAAAPDANAQAPFRPAESPAAAGFGIQNGAQPDAAITQELDALFS